MWPSGQMDHVHIDPVLLRSILKKKLRTKPAGWSKAANPRTNAARNKGKTLAPRKRAYGPF